MIFTANASAALGSSARRSRSEAGSRLVLSADNHNSVNGIREFARPRGAAVHYVPLDGELRLVDPRRASRTSRGAEPVRVSGAVELLGRAAPAVARRGGAPRGLHVLLDAAAFVPDEPAAACDAVRPDFVALSFYKMFGYPTGLGALIARRDALAALGAAVVLGRHGGVRVGAAGTHLLKAGAEGFEDGTANFGASRRWRPASSC